MSSAPSNRQSPAASGAAASPPPPGIPDYELVRIVGRGSYGDVWLARSVTGAWRAIKVVWRDRFANAEPFEREFRGLKEFADISLGESSQMTLLHVGRNDAAGFFYYVMELADDAERGRNIDPQTYVPLTLAEMRLRHGCIPAGECVRIGAEVARGLASLHRRGLVHRDVKPSNIILVSGVPKLADIGLIAPMANAMTFVGTEGYVPPDGPGSPGADVFALGKVLYELSTGHDRQEFPKLPASLARLPDRSALLELNEIFLRACGPTPAERYADGAAILADLAALGRGTSLRTRRLLGSVLRVAAVLALAVGLGVGGWWWAKRPASIVPVAAGLSPHSVAVLPFVNATGDPAQEYFSDGISDELLHALSRERHLRVTGSRAAFWAKGQSLPRSEIARRLRVAYLVEGSVQQIGTRIRLQVSLMPGLDGAEIDLGLFERERSDVFVLQDQVARAIAQKILGRVAMPPLRPSTANMEAYDEFLRGRAVQVREVSGVALAAKHFERAVELDPRFAVAWARLADTRRMIGQYKRDWGLLSAAVSPAERALAEQPDLALAWSVQGVVHAFTQRDSAAGLRDLMRSEELGGENAETLMLRFIVTWFAGEAQSLLPLAREALNSNPENIERMTVVPLALWYLGDYAEADRLYAQTGNDYSRVFLRQNWRGAEAALRFAESLPADHPHSVGWRARMLAALGRKEEAVRLLESARTPQSWQAYAVSGMIERARERAAEELPRLQNGFRELGRNPSPDREPIHLDRFRAQLIGIELLFDRRDAALALLEEWRLEAQQRKPNRRSGGDAINDMPRYYAELGQRDVAIALLRQFLADGRALGYELRDTPGYASLRDDPRFIALRKQAEAWAARQPDPPENPRPAAR